MTSDRLDAIDAIEELIPAYALNALEEEDRELVERALEQNPRYQEKLAEYLDTVAQLSAMHHPTVPPTALWGRVLASRPPEPPDPTEAALDMLARRSREDPGRRRGVWGMAAALVLAVVGLGTFSFIQHQQVQGLGRELEALTAETAEAEQRLTAQQALTLWAAHPDVSATAMRDVSVRSASPVATRARNPRGMVLHAPEGDAVLVTRYLPPLAEYLSYQVWGWDQQGRLYSLGVFEVDEHGYAQVALSFPDHAPSIQNISVSVEPAGGSTAPSGRAILDGRVGGESPNP